MGRARDLANILSSSGNVALDNELGLSLITPTSIAVTSGSGLISTTGTVSFTSASAISLNNVFSSTYTIYKLLINLDSNSADATIYLKMRSGTTDASGANYNLGRDQINRTGSAITSVAQNDVSTGFSLGQVDGQIPGHYLGVEITLHYPFVTNTTLMNYVGTYIGTDSNVYSSAGAGLHTPFTSYDGVSLIASSGTITGTISVYGYRK